MSDVTNTSVPDSLGPDDMALWQLAVTHVLGHPNLAAALKQAALEKVGDNVPEVDASTELAQHGISLPWGSTAHLLRTEETTDGGAAGKYTGGYHGVRVCVLISGHVHCVEFHPPIIFSAE